MGYPKYTLKFGDRPLKGCKFSYDAPWYMCVRLQYDGCSCPHGQHIARIMQAVNRVEDPDSEYTYITKGRVNR